jgi:hypothetical protein
MGIKRNDAREEKKKIQYKGDKGIGGDREMGLAN